MAEEGAECSRGGQKKTEARELADVTSHWHLQHPVMRDLSHHGNIIVEDTTGLFRALCPVVFQYL